jgi:hypothetical protein
MPIMPPTAPPLLASDDRLEHKPAHLSPLPNFIPSAVASPFNAKNMNSSFNDINVTQGTQYPNRRATAHLARRCERTYAQLTRTIERSQEQLASACSTFPIEEAPWRLPSGLTMLDDESDLGRGIQFLSD